MSPVVFTVAKIQIMLLWVIQSSVEVNKHLESTLFRRCTNSWHPVASTTELCRVMPVLVGYKYTTCCASYFWCL